MILTTILLIIMAMLIVFGVLIIGVGGGIFTIVFADVIVCIFLIGLLLRALFKKK